MSHVLAGLRPVPVLRVRWNESHVTGADRLLLALVGHGAFPVGDDEDLIARVHMPLVHGTVGEVDLGQPQIAAHLLADGGLTQYLADEDRVVALYPTGFRHVYDAHVLILSQT